MKVLRRLIAPPALESDDEAQPAQIFHRVMLTTMAFASPVLILMPLVQPELLGRATFALLGVNGLGVALLQINRGGRTTLASAVLVGGLVTLVTLLSLTAGGVRSPGITMYFIFVLMAGLLLGRRAGIRVAVICAALGLGLVILERAGSLPVARSIYGPEAIWLLNCLYIGLVLALMRIGTSALARSLLRVKAELRERRAAEREREQALIALGERVKELRLLHSVAQLLRDRPFDRSVLEELVQKVPEAFMYPAICKARIAFQNMEVTSPGWRETPWQLLRTFSTSGGMGTIDVRYLEAQSTAADPFLPEEHALIASLAEMLVSYLERDQVERRRRATEQQLRQSQKMEALGTLAGGIAHDFNNILTAIVGNAELGLEEIDAMNPARASLEQIQQASARAADIVKRILLFSRRQESEHRIMPIRPVVEEAVKLVRVSMAKNIKVRTTFPEPIPPISGDASQLYQVVMNLATNATHAMSTSGGELSVEVDVVDLSARDLAESTDLHEGRYVHVTVGDTGTGMSRETLERVFEPFFTTKGHGGTGLGLSVVHGIVQDHGGTIRVDSELGSGTTFHVYLPVAAAEQAAEGGTPTRIRGDGEQIMYVDDEEALISVMQRMLRLLGYHCVGFTSPGAAIAAFRASPDAWAAVITDLAMPVMSGVDLARQLKAIKSDVRVILASGHAEEATRALQAGISARIQKPYVIDTVGTTVHQLLSK